MQQQMIDEAAKMLKAIGNAKRLEILYVLAEKELNVGELEKIIGLSQSALSQHLAVLRVENLVKTRRVAQTIFYSIQNRKIYDVLAMLEQLFGNREAKTRE